MQVMQNGTGLVAHGMQFNRNFCKLRVSVWYDTYGRVTDCEGFDSLNRSRPVPEKVKKHLGAELGLVMAIARRNGVPFTLRVAPLAL